MHIMVHIGIDATRVASRRWGITNFIFHLLAHLPEALEALPEAVVTAFVSAAEEPSLRALLPIGRRLRLLPVPDGHPIIREQAYLPCRALTSGLHLDLFHAPGFPAPLLVPARRLVVSVHDVVFKTHGHTMTPGSRWYWRLLFPQMLRRADVITTTTMTVASDLAQHYRAARDKAVRLVPLGVGEEYSCGVSEARIRQVAARYGLPPDYLVWVGALQPRKNLPFLIDVYAQLRQRLPESSGLKLVLIGSKTWKSEAIAEQVAACGVESHVVFPGYVDGDDLPAILAGARAFVFPSLHEGFGMPAVEAMACGTPVLAAATGALPEVIGDAGILLPLDAEAWVSALQRVLTDAALVADLRRRGIDRAQGFTWRRCAERIVEVYREGLEGVPVCVGGVLLGQR